MDLFVVIVEDRHADVDVRVFSSAERAVEAAKQDAVDNARSPESIEEEDLTGAGILYFATWSTEGDCVSVVTRPLDDGATASAGPPAPLVSAATIAGAAAMEERDRVAGGPPWEVPSHPENFQPGGWHHGQIR
jgi:hypothetical protein